MFNRGKLHFLGAKDDRIKLINERINLTEKHLIEICQSFATCSRRLAKYRDAYDELAKKFYNYGEEEEVNQSLIDGIKNMSNAATILADHMDLNVQRLEFKIVNELALFDTLCKSTRDNLRMAVNMRDKEVYKQKQMLQIKSKFSPNNTATDSELLKGKMEVRRSNKEIDKIIVNFEKRKLYDLKVILNDFILINMKCHVKSLEVLTECYNHMKQVDEVDDLRIFRKIIKTKWDDVDLINQKKTIKENTRSNLSKSMESLNHEPSLSPLKIDKKLSSSVKSMEEMDPDSNSIEDENDENDEDDDNDDDDDLLSDKGESSENSDNKDVDKDSKKSASIDNAKRERSNVKNKYDNRDHGDEEVEYVKRHPFKTSAASHALKHIETRNVKQVHENAFHITSSAREKNSHISLKATESLTNRSKRTEHKGKELIRRGGGDGGRGGEGGGASVGGDTSHQVKFVESNKVEKETIRTNEPIIDCTRAVRM